MLKEKCLELKSCGNDLC